MYIYYSNESETNVEVFFDDFKVEHVHGKLVQEEDYYPFGLTYNSYQRESSVVNRYQFQSKEFQNELDLDLYDFEWRQYDPIIARTTTQDPHADSYFDLSPYSFFVNNPINTLDPIGMDTIPVNQVDPHTINPEEDVVLLDEVVVTASSEDGSDSNDGDDDSAAATAVPLVLTPEVVGTGLVVTVSAPVILLTTIFTLIPNSTADGEMEALAADRQAWEEMQLESKGGKQNIWPDDYGYPPNQKDIDWSKSDSELANGISDSYGDPRKGPDSPNNKAKKWFRDKRVK